MNTSWLSITALQAGLTLPDMLPQSEVGFYIKYIISEARFSHYVEIKEAISPFFLIYVFLLLSSVHVLPFLYFVLGVYIWPSNCCVAAFVALGKKCLETLTF